MSVDDAERKVEAIHPTSLCSPRISTYQVLVISSLVKIRLITCFGSSKLQTGEVVVHTVRVVSPVYSLPQAMASVSLLATKIYPPSRAHQLSMAKWNHSQGFSSTAVVRRSPMHREIEYFLKPHVKVCPTCFKKFNNRRAMLQHLNNRFKCQAQLPNDIRLQLGEEIRRVLTPLKYRV